MLRALIDFTLSNARRFYSSMGNLLDRKGLRRKLYDEDPETKIDNDSVLYRLLLKNFSLYNTTNRLEHLLGPASTHGIFASGCLLNTQQLVHV